MTRRHSSTQRLYVCARRGYLTRYYVNRAKRITRHPPRGTRLRSYTVPKHRAAEHLTPLGQVHTTFERVRKRIHTDTEGWEEKNEKKKKTPPHSIIIRSPKQNQYIGDAPRTPINNANKMLYLSFKINIYDIALNPLLDSSLFLVRRSSLFLALSVKLAYTHTASSQ